MKTKDFETIDGNEAAARVAYQLNEVIAIYPTAMQNQKAAVLSGQWLLYRYNPEQATKGETLLHVDSAAPKLAVEEYFNLENRFKMLSKSRPADAKRLFKEAQKQVDARWQLYQRLARSGSPDKENIKA